MKGVMEITTKDLDSGKRFVVTTYYDEKYTISKEGIAFDSPFTFRPDENFEGDVKIIRCRVGSWLQAKIKVNGRKPFSPNSINVTKIEPLFS